MKKIKVALIGTGNWSLQHCRILSQSPQVEFCGILGRNKDRTKERAKLYDVPYYIDFKELIKNPDVAIDATGKAIARKNALQALAKRGVLVMVGNGEGLEFEQYPDMGGPERSILGSEYFSYNEMEANHELLKNNQEYLSQIITHQYNIEDVQKSYEHFFSPESDAGKIAVVHN